MSLIFTKRERRQARAYRGMIKRARVRAKGRGPPAPPAVARYKGREIAKAHKAAIADLFCIATALRHGLEVYGSTKRWRTPVRCSATGC
jgi:hypothetical protein